jgi:transcriptional regulatory protein LevR
MNELAYITEKIQEEINELQSYKKQLRKFFYKESVKGKLLAIDFNRIIDEIERITLEINHLQSLIIEYSNIVELNDKRY